jgi:hypothetical protein
LLLKDCQGFREDTAVCSEDSVLESSSFTNSRFHVLQGFVAARAKGSAPLSLVACTYEPGLEGDFLLHVFSAAPLQRPPVLLGPLTVREAAAQAAARASAGTAALEAARRAAAVRSMEEAAHDSEPGSAARAHLEDFQAGCKALQEKRATKAGFHDAWSCVESLGSLDDVSGGVVWVRVAKLAPAPALLGAGGFSFSDVRQGELGDCYFLSALAELCMQAPEALDSALLATDLHESGWHGVRFWVGDRWRLIIIDDLIPCHAKKFQKLSPGSMLSGKGASDSPPTYGGEPDPEQGRYYVPLMAGAPQGHAWVMLLEKAFAKLSGSYGDICSGSTLEALELFLPHAAPGFTLALKDPFSNMPGRSSSTAGTEELLPTLSAWLQKKWLVSASSREGSGPGGAGPGSSNEAKSQDGLVSGHAYSVLRAACTADGTQLVQLRNPWGSFEWKGQFSDSDLASWTPQLRAQLCYDPEQGKDDGIFWMPGSAFLQRFTTLSIMRKMRLASEGTGGRWRKCSVLGSFHQELALPTGGFTAGGLLKFQQFGLSLGAGTETEPVRLLVKLTERAVSQSRQKEHRASAAVMVFRRQQGPSAAAAAAVAAGPQALSSAALNLSSLSFSNSVNAPGDSAVSFSDDFEVSLELLVTPAEGPFVLIPVFKGDLFAESGSSSRAYSLSLFAASSMQLLSINCPSQPVQHF